jgi:hypothetical protein
LVFNEIYYCVNFTGTIFLQTGGGGTLGDKVKIYIANTVTANIFILGNLLSQAGISTSLTLTQTGGACEFICLDGPNNLFTGTYTGTFDGSNNVCYQNNVRNPIMYNSAGLLTNPKIWVGTATTNASGVFTAAINSAGFASILNVQANCVLAGSNSTNAPIATIQTATTSTITGLCVESAAVSALGGNGLTNVPSGRLVYITVTGL